MISLHSPARNFTFNTHICSSAQLPFQLRLQRPCHRLTQRVQQKTSFRAVCQRRSLRCQAVGKSSKPAGEPFFAINMTVRDYELDQYGVVNNAVYLNYLQHVREEWMHHIGFNSGEFARSGNALALSECNVKYMRPLRSRDMFNSRAWVTKVSATSFHLYQELVKIEQDAQACKEEVALIATCIVVCLDTRYRPARIKPEWKEKLMLGRSLESSSPKSNGAHAPSKEAVKAVA